MEVQVQSGEITHTWTVEDRGKDGDSSMARTTGLVTFACVVAWTEYPLFNEGIHPPEDLPSKVIQNVIQTLKDEGVSIEFQSDDHR